MEEIKKSFKSILYERTTSPFYGTFIISWLIWNWKIIYVTLFVSEKIIKTDKLSYIINNHLIDKLNLILWPIISTIVLLTVFPFISNGAYWLKLKFDKWKKEKKNELELKKLLTLEQSIELREQISNQEERFEKILSDKNLRIEQLELLLSETKSDNYSDPNIIDSGNINNELIELSEKIKSNEVSQKQYNGLVHYIQTGYQVSIENVPTSFLALMESNDVIKSIGNRVYGWGEHGKEFHKLMTN